MCGGRPRNGGRECGDRGTLGRQRREFHPFGRGVIWAARKSRKIGRIVSGSVPWVTVFVLHSKNAVVNLAQLHTCLCQAARERKAQRRERRWSDMPSRDAADFSCAARIFRRLYMPFQSRRTVASSVAACTAELDHVLQSEPQGKCRMDGNATGAHRPNPGGWKDGQWHPRPRVEV